MELSDHVAIVGRPRHRQGRGLGGSREIAETEGTSVEEIERRGTHSVPLRCANEPEDIAAMIVFLASPGASNITGQAFNVVMAVSPH